MPSPSELYAALDLGSNSFHLLIVSFDGDKMNVLDRHKDMVRFAAGLDHQDYLSEKTQQKALESLARMSERLRGIPSSHIRVVGTNTLRAATNAVDFLLQAEEVLGVPINIISGTEEARLVYLGVAYDFSPGDQRRLVIDIGGGSTELIVGQTQPASLESLPLGCVSFSKRFFPNGEISESAWRHAVTAAKQEISPYVEAFRNHWDQAVGSSGTIRAIGRIAAAHQWSDDGAITTQALKQITDALLQAKHTRQLKLNGLPQERLEVFPGGLAIFAALAQELDIHQLMPTEYALREGVIHDLAGRLRHHDVRDSTISFFQRQYHVDTVQAKRVAFLTQHWLKQVNGHTRYDKREAANLLRWAAQLHEIGLSIAHGGHHRHGAYILSNADMPGFSKQEQARLSFLVLNQRRKLRAPELIYGLKPDWLLVCLLRLACIFYRRRQPRDLPQGFQLHAGERQLTVIIPEQWYAANPLTAADLADEIALLKNVEFTLHIDILQ